MAASREALESASKSSLFSASAWLTTAEVLLRESHPDTKVPTYSSLAAIGESSSKIHGMNDIEIDADIERSSIDLSLIHISEPTRPY